MKTFILRLSDNIHEKAKKLAQQEDRSIVSLYRKIIYRYFQKRGDH